MNPQEKVTYTNDNGDIKVTDRRFQSELESIGWRIVKEKVKSSKKAKPAEEAGEAED